MSIIKKHLHSILNAKTSRLYALEEDEEAALLSTFRDISVRVHEEAGREILPYELGEPFLVDYEPVFGSPFAKVSRTAHYVSYMTRLLVSARHLIQSVGQLLRPRESVLHEEEELALFGTIEEVSREVRREAAACGIFTDGEGAPFVAAYERERVSGEPTTKSLPKGIRDTLAAMSLWRKAQKMARQPWAIIHMYSEYMDEELSLIGGIMDRNNAVKQAYVRAHPAAG